jgi:phage gp37-like protein
MREEALEAYERDEVERAVRTVLDAHPEGLSGPAIRRQIHQHPALDVELPMQYVHPWLGELCRDGILIGTATEWRYQLTEYADSEGHQ